MIPCLRTMAHLVALSAFLCFSRGSVRPLGGLSRNADRDLIERGPPSEALVLPVILVSQSGGSMFRNGWILHEGHKRRLENPAGTAFSSTAPSKPLTAMLIVISERLPARAKPSSHIKSFWSRLHTEPCHTRMSREEDSGAPGPQAVGCTTFSDRCFVPTLRVAPGKTTQVVAD